MDPALFRIDWEVLTEVMISIVVLSFFIERSLALLFEHKIWVKTRCKDSGFKEPIALFLSFIVVRYWNFDALGIIFHSDKASFWGYLVTAAIIAGGSKASIKLFQNVLNVKSTTFAEAEKKG
jgi:hypothetical protein